MKQYFTILSQERLAIPSRLLALLLVTGLSLLLLACNGKSTSSSNQENSTATDKKELNENAKPSTNWVYDEKVDPLTDEMIYIAYCPSLEEQMVCGYRTPLHLGVTHVNGLDFITLAVREGRLKKDNLPVAYVRFDSGEVEMWSVIADAPTVHHIVSRDRFLAQLKRSKKCAVKVETYDGRTATYTFNTEGLVWNH